MVHQNRPFFRKLVQYEHNLTNLNRSNRNSYKNATGRKLTPHKTMRVFRRYRFKALTTLRVNAVFKLVGVTFDQLGKGIMSLWQDKMGAVLRTRWIGGSPINQFYKTYVNHNHVIFSKFFIKTFALRPLPLVTITCNRSVVGSFSFRTSWLDNAGLLEVRGAKPLYFYNTYSILSKESDIYWKPNAITSRVRGIAKNPVDHPNGGRANTKGSFKTPWGRYAKAGK